MKNRLAGNGFSELAWRYVCLTFLYISIVTSVGCRSGETSSSPHYERQGESVIVPFAWRDVTNSVVLWAHQLSNGYSLLSNEETHEAYIPLKNDPATMFLLRNEDNPISPWGISECSSDTNGYFWGNVIIRVSPVSPGETRLSAAIHGRHFERGLAWDIHNFEFGNTKTAAMPACPKDEQKILKQIEGVIKNQK